MNKKGFTLVELIVVIAILGILAGVAIPAYSGYINEAKKAADLTKLDAIKTAVFAVNATKGQVTKIVVNRTGVTEVAISPDTVTAEKNIESYYNGGYSFEYFTTGATWENGAWS